MTKTYEERIKAAEQRKAAAEQELKKLKILQTEQARKDRTKRLIETGAVIEKAIGIEFDTPAKRQALLDLLCKERNDKNGNPVSYADLIRSSFNVSMGTESQS